MLIILLLSERVTFKNIDYRYFNSTLPSDFKEDDARFRVQMNVDFLLFYAILFFTCVVGIIELLPEIKSEQNKQVKFCLGFLFFGLVGVFDYCIFRVYEIFVENALISRSSRIGSEFNVLAEISPSLFDPIILEPLMKVLVIAAIAILSAISVVLYYFKLWGKVNLKRNE